MQTITTADLAGLGDDITLIDVRETNEYAEARIPHAVSVPMSQLGERLDEVPDDRTTYVVCQGGVRSARVIEALEPRGWQQLVNVEGGTGQWIAEGRPTTQG
ncbi:MAG: rhodanese-like domain-containing protein [Pseudoclavibacter sp.]